MTPHPTADAPLFSAVIRPNASLGRAGMFVVIGTIGGISFVLGVLFASMGAWPVFGFLGLDVLLVYLAFRAHRRGQRAYEEVRVTSEAVTVRRVDPEGRAGEIVLNPYWARVKRRLMAEEGVIGLTLTSHGRAVEIARDLSPAERATFADALEAALAKARGATG
jgi:uncharacterized membrane protein